MRAEGVEESGARTGNLAPAVAGLRAIAIDAGFEEHDPSEKIPANRILHGEKIAVPAPVLEHGQQDVLLLRNSREMPRLLDGNGERLVHPDVAAGVQRQVRERRVRLIGARDYDEVDIRIRR